MTEQEWDVLTAEIEATFRGELAEDREAVLKAHFAAMDYERVRTAVLRLSTGGQVFMPVPGELHEAMKAVERVPAMPFTEALPIILDELLAAKRKAQGREREALIGAVSAIAARCGEGAARWAAARGFALLQEQIYDPDMGGAIKGSLAKDYLTLVDAADGDGKTGLALSMAGRREGGGLRALDPLAALGAEDRKGIGSGDAH